MQEPRLLKFLYNFKYNPRAKFIASEKYAEGSFPDRKKFWMLATFNTMHTVPWHLETSLSMVFLVSIVCMFCPNAISVYILMSEFII